MLSTAARYALPRFSPPPHDPRDRVVLDVIEGWEVRVFEPVGAVECSLRMKGFDHLQFWHPPAGFSMLTPSILTGQEFEVYPFAHRKYSCADYQALRQTVREALHLTLPSPFIVETLLEIFTEVYENGRGVDSGLSSSLIGTSGFPSLLPSK